MLHGIRNCAVVVLLLVAAAGQGQKIVYSEPEKDDTRRLNFEIIGKFGSNVLIYKNVHNRGYMCLYDNDMKQTGKVEMEYLPSERLINVDFFPYADYTYVLYEYQKKNVVYCMAAKVDGEGKLAGEVQQLDSTHIGFAVNNKIYSAVVSEDRERIDLFKINSRNKDNYVLTTLLFNRNLDLLHRSVVNIPMEIRNEYLDEFHVDNDGDLVFTKFQRSGSDNITSASLMIQRAGVDSLVQNRLDIDKTLLDEIHVKIDNVNKHYFLVSFFYQQRRGNIDGLYFYVWDKQAGQGIMENTVTFGDELRKEAKGESNTHAAFNDYFIRNIILKRDGGFIIGSEAYYTTSRYNSWNRWDYLYGNPFMTPYDYYYYSPYMWRYGYPYYNSNQAVRYHADNVVLLSFSNTGKLEWSNVIAKEQFDDEGDARVSYQIMNTGGQVHLLFNQQERRILLLNDYALSPDGQVTRNPTLRGLDKGYEFMARYGKQVSAKQIIIPCFYRNYICFAKVDYN
ncbi:MAG TPA: hypothetical protein VG870_09135 [Chitinophagaceae bacterium]|nr:hypothetical protein [Chitinophagaceae bacterium]